MGPRIIAIAVFAGISTVDPGTFVRYGLYAALAVWILGSPGRLRIDGVFWAVAASTIWMFLTTHWAINPEAGAAFQTALIFAVFMLLGRDAIRTRRQLQVVATGFLIGVFIGALRIIGEHYNLIPSSTPDESANARLTLGDLNANYVGYSMAGGLAVVVLLWLLTKSKRVKFSLFIAAIALVAGFIFTDTRGSLIAGVILLAWLILARMTKKPPIWILVLGVTVAATVIATGSGVTSLKVLDFGSRATGDFSGRLPIWDQVRPLWNEFWLTGAGPFATRVATDGQVSAHNFVLEIGSSQGMIGLILFVIMLWTVLWTANRASDQKYRRTIVGAFIAASAPAYLTGAWESSAAAWVLLMIMSKASVPPAPTPSTDHERLDATTTRGLAR
ncbi:O-antigen ligase family protein [Microbacterium sp. 13-71-7]|uniref:O-antigen ligase family protein n=1 Tax=Microbacterium sp. 13-71-7 TaxID=1970399 RepID=UPI000BC54E38|nr:O-antigen ligase family protein [Microbacterium sp. 13-71-7]OZB81738.1 MAG: hypothetical protein B7X32_15875 [Microbacterium sp. 13-71-7]